MVPPQTEPALSNQFNWFSNITGDQNQSKELGNHSREPDLWDPGIYISKTSPGDSDTASTTDH